MPKIQGRVIYDTRREIFIEDLSQPLKNVPVVLYNLTTRLGVGVLTDNDGNFSFDNVVSGTYRVVEAWGTEVTNIGTIDYNNATAISAPIPKDPPITAVTNPHPNANKLDSTSPNTIIVTVARVDITNLIFFDAPIENKNLFIIGDTFGDNLINNANKGNWGELPAGSRYRTIENRNPYSDLISGLRYSKTYPPSNGEITITNMVNSYRDWWYVTDHTVGDETGRVLVVNGENPRAVFFKDKITVEPNNYYFLSYWITNMNNPRFLGPLPQPQIGIRVSNKNSEIIYSENLKDIPRTDILTWIEVGGVFNSGDNTELTLALSTENPNLAGNDFAIDDISIRKFDISNALNIEKKTDKCLVHLNDIVTYNITIFNNAQYVIENIFFQDMIDVNTSFVVGSIIVDESGLGYETSNPTTGFNIGNIEPNSQKKVQFKVKMISVPENRLIPNTATVSYIFFKSQTGDIFRMNSNSNELTLKNPRNDFRQELTNIKESIVLEKTALSSIIKAEDDKIKKASEVSNNNKDLIAINNSVKNTIEAINTLENVLHKKKIIASCMTSIDESDYGICNDFF